MKFCTRCHHPHNCPDSPVCPDCWVELGQMTFEWEDDDQFERPIDTVFDREEEARGYQ